MAIDVTLVAIPSRHDPVWNLSSEKVPHLTLLYLGEQVENLDRIENFMAHAIETSLDPFMLGVDRRGLLGSHDADVLFFNKNEARYIEKFRNLLLQQEDIFKAYHLVDQYPTWTPHLTLGYPKTPAKSSEPFGGFVTFDRIALWTGDYEGREFPLTSDERLVEASHTALRGQEYLEHFGIKGMQWGVRRAEKKAAREQSRWAGGAMSPQRYIKVNNAAADRMNTVHIPRMNNKPEYRNADFTKPSPLRDKYHKEYLRLLERELNDASRSIGGDIDPTKKKRLKYEITPGGDVQYRLTDVRHADDDAMFVALTDDDGRIYKFDTQTLEQSDPVEEFLEHFGVKGMKWGVIRDKGAGAVRDAYVPSQDAIAARKYAIRAKLGGVQNLDNNEMRKVIERMVLEARYKELYGERQWHNAGVKFASNLLGEVLKETAASWLSNPFARRSRRKEGPIRTQSWTAGQDFAKLLEEDANKRRAISS